jgi:hypothetical protein
MKRYHVSGSMPIFGNQPGTEFELEIPLEQEARLLAAGALREIGAATSAKTRRRTGRTAARPARATSAKTRRRTGRTAARPATTTTDAHGTATGAGADRED